MANENSFVEIKIFAKNIDIEKIKFNINQAFGDDRKTIKENNLALPFLKEKRIKLCNLIMEVSVIMMIIQDML